MLNLSGKTALVTGASSGIGREIATVLAHRGAAALVLVGRRRERLVALADRLSSETTPPVRCYVRPLDLQDRAATSAMLDGLEAEGLHIDVLVNNAGFGDRGLFERRSWNKIEALLELNVVSATYLAHRLVPPMVARGEGGILNIGSIAGIVRGIL